MLWTGSKLDRVRKCGRVAHGEYVAVARREDRAHLTGLTTCGSVWACPVCSARIWAERGDELRRGIEAWHAMGGRVVMVTLTMRHKRRHELAELWDALGHAWTAARGGYRSARVALERVGACGWARAIEATHGANGWHLHVHALMFLAGEVDEGGVRRELRESDVERLADAMYGAWSRSLGRPGRDGADRGLTPTREVGVDAQLVDNDSAAGEAFGAYLAKATYGEASAAMEVAGQHAKRANAGNRTPWGILSDLCRLNCDTRADAALWAEWERASRGKRALTWAQGFRDYLLDEPERTDEEIAEDADEDRVPVALLPVLVWNELREVRHGPATVLEAAEAVSVEDGLSAVNAVLRALGCGRALAPPVGSDPGSSIARSSHTNERTAR